MNAAAEILSRAAALGIRLRLNGDAVRMDGPKEARDALRPDVIAHKPEIIAYLRVAESESLPLPDDCAGAPHDPDGGLYLPWGPYLSPDDVRCMRADLVALIEELSSLECWPKAHREEVLTAAIRGPLSALLPDLGHFTGRLTEARAEAAAREALSRRTWRMEGFYNRGAE